MTDKKKHRHRWGDLEVFSYTEQQQCIDCGLYRFKIFGMWQYCKDAHTKNITDGLNNQIIANPGCNG